MSADEAASRTSNRATISKILLGLVLSGLIGAALGCLATYFILTDQADQAGLVSASKGVPNFIIFLADDTGYGDFQVYGHPNQERNGVDRMAEEGMRFTHFYTPVAICSPSRAAILTGRYPIRSGIVGLIPAFAPMSPGGLPRAEHTIAEALKHRGYATGMAGKWHLGINKYNNSDGFHLPMHHGFDEVDTMLPFTQTWFCKQYASYFPAMSTNCFLYKGDQIIEQPINLGTLTSRLVKDTISFINRHKDEPFFYLLSFPQTHAALFSDRRFSGKSRRGPYGDNVNEMGWAVNEVLNELVKLGIDRNTLALFLSDHGPVRDGCGEEGSNGNFRGGKYTTWEGGVRIPAIAWWPGNINPNSVSHDVLSTIDLFPTILHLTGTHNYSKSNSNAIDGKSFDMILRGDKTEPLHKALFFYCGETLTAVRYGKYKVHFYTSDRSNDDIVKEGSPSCVFKGAGRLREYGLSLRCSNTFKKLDSPLIFDVEADPREHISLDPDGVQYLMIMTSVNESVHLHKSSIISVESEMDKPWSPSLQPCCEPPTCMCNFEG